MDNELSRRSMIRGGAIAAGVAAVALQWPADQAVADPSPKRRDGQQGVAELWPTLRATWPDNRTVNVVWHGHSVPAGYHLTPQVKPLESYPFMVYRGLNERFPTAVLNNITTAIGGENSVHGAARFRHDVLGTDPDLLFIDYAINDRSLLVKDVERAWCSMIEHALRRGVPLVLLTPTGTRFDDLADPGNVLAVRAELIRELGRRHHVAVADVSVAWQKVLDAGTDQETLLAQGVHPNQAGHEIAAAEILRTIDRLRGEG